MTGAPQTFGVGGSCGTGCMSRLTSGRWDAGAYPYGNILIPFRPPVSRQLLIRVLPKCEPPSIEALSELQSPRSLCLEPQTPAARVAAESPVCYNQRSSDARVRLGGNPLACTLGAADPCRGSACSGLALARILSSGQDRDARQRMDPCGLWRQPVASGRFVFVLARRLLGPQAFGIAALATVFLSGLEMLTDLGVGMDVVQHHRGDDPVFINTAFLFSRCEDSFFAAWLQPWPFRLPVSITSLRSAGWPLSPLFRWASGDLLVAPSGR